MCRSMIVMKQFQRSQIRFSPLLIRSLMVLPLSAFGTAEDAAFMRKNPTELHTTAEKLRWYRLHARLSQRELSEQLGISRAVYRHYEDGRQSLYPKRQLIALAKLYGVKYTDLADGYTLFVHRGQSKQLARRRMALGMDKKQYAEHLGVSAHDYRAWESGRVQISKPNWEKYFDDAKGRAK